MMADIRKYAGAREMRELARRDVKAEIDRMIKQPQGTNDGKETPDSIAYVAELRRIMVRLIPRLR